MNDIELTLKIFEDLYTYAQKNNIIIDDTLIEDNEISFVFGQIHIDITYLDYISEFESLIIYYDSEDEKFISIKCNFQSLCDFINYIDLLKGSKLCKKPTKK